MVMPIAGGIGLATRRDGRPDAPSTADSYFADIIRSSAQSAWAEYRGELRTAIYNEIGRGDRIAPGVTLYDITLDIAADIDLTVERDDNGDLLVHLVTGGSYIEATSTTPTDFGSYADPRFSFAFGLDLTYRIDLPPTTQPLQSTGFTAIHVVSPKLDSHNFIADLAFLINDVINFFAGVDFVGVLEKFIAATDFAPKVNESLAPLNEKLTQLAAAGYWFLEAVVDRLDGASGDLRGLSLPGAPQNKLDLLLTVVGFDRSGAIEGEITWPRSLGAPTTSHAIQRPEAALEVTSAVHLSAATTAALQSVRTGEWTALATASTAASAAVVAPAAVAPAATPEAGGDDAGSLAASNLASALGAMNEADRATAALEVRAGSADRFVELIGGPAQYATLRAQFLSGRTDFTVSATTAVGGDGLFADQRPVGTMSNLWADDDDTSYRRRYLVVDLPIDAPLSVTCAVAPPFHWGGPVTDVVAQPSGWSGTVTIHPAPAKTSLADALKDQVHIQLADKRRFAHPDRLKERGIIIVGGAGDPGESVSLNPQPLPPRELVTDQIDLTAHTHASAGAFAAAAGPTARANRSAFSVAGKAARWGEVVTAVAEEHASAVAALVRDNPSGSGTVRGIDFTITEYVAPIVR
ncbi:MAG: hypothetical protein JWM93_3533 [Frankiales bacterium]|nr:hypothetical protein [Frankiales bacterium]